MNKKILPANKAGLPATPGRTTMTQVQPRTVQAKSAHVSQPRAMSQNGRAPVAPPAYRPQPVPKVLQRKLATSPSISSAVQPGRTPVAPPVYRPQPPPKVLQGSMANNRPRQTVAASRPSSVSPPVLRSQPRNAVQQKAQATSVVARNRIERPGFGAPVFAPNPLSHFNHHRPNLPTSPGIKLRANECLQRQCSLGTMMMNQNQAQRIVGGQPSPQDMLQHLVIQAKMQPSPSLNVIQANGWKTSYVWIIRVQSLLTTVLSICTLSGAALTVIGALTLASVLMTLGRLWWETYQEESTQNELTKLEKMVDGIAKATPLTTLAIVQVAGGAAGVAGIVSGIVGLLVTFVGHILTAGSVDNYRNIERNLRQKLSGWVKCSNPSQDWSDLINPCGSSDLHQQLI